MENSFLFPELPMGINRESNSPIDQLRYQSVLGLIQFPSCFFSHRQTFALSWIRFAFAFNLFQQSASLRRSSRSRDFYSPRKLKIRIRLPAPSDDLFAPKNVTVIVNTANLVGICSHLLVSSCLTQVLSNPPKTTIYTDLGST